MEKDLKLQTFDGRRVNLSDVTDQHLCNIVHYSEHIGMSALMLWHGDQVRDESGFYAVFSEQGTSASHLAAAKFLDALARMPGKQGQDSDAVGGLYSSSS